MSRDKNGPAALTGVVGFLVLTYLLSPEVVALIHNLNAADVPAAFDKIENQFIGILVGIISAELYNKFSTVQLPKALSFFSGKRLVPIIMSFAMIAMAYVLFYVWPVIFDALVNFGESVQGLGAIGAGIFGFCNRLLIPFGLHHALNSVFWFDVAGINDIPKFLAGAQTIAQEGEAVKGVVGMYQAGFFPIMMFGLLGAALAFVRTARPENRTKISSIMIAAGFASFFTGVTEPLEFSFLFLAPPLYALHAVFSGLSLYIAAQMQWMAGFGFSAGLVDMVLSAQNPLAVNWYMLIVQGLFFFALYYFSFSFIIRKWNLKTPGREDPVQAETIAPRKEHTDLAGLVLPLIGGKDNIKTIDNCVTRLRLELKNPSLVQEGKLNAIVPGVLVLGSNAVQVVIGTQAEFIADALSFIVTGKRQAVSEASGSDNSASTSSATPANGIPETHADIAAAILPLLGGKENIVEIDNCITRLRLEVKDSGLVRKDALNQVVSGVLVAGKTAVQVIIGTEVEFVATEFKKLV